MRKRILSWPLGLCLMLCFFWCFVARGEETSLSAIICSDLHFTLKGVSAAIVSGMQYGPEIADAIMAEVVDRHPDVFLMLGDNTNSGSEGDMAALSEKLRRVRDAGIQVVVVTGNHDLDHATLENFEEVYMPLCTPIERDTDSLSYVAEVGGVILLAMDDNAYTQGRIGSFSPDTLRWLGRMLEKYKEKPKLFLSHHNVLLGKGSEKSDSYRIQNDDLSRVLERYGVSLCLTGHLHSQNIVEEGGMHEVVSAMPLSSPYYLGFLSMQDGKGEYHAESIDFMTYGAGDLGSRMEKLEEESAAASRESMAQTVAKSDYSSEEQEKILDLIMKFLSYYSRGNLGEHLEEIRGDEYCDRMIDALWDYNYGPWMYSTLQGTPMVASSLSFTYGESK